MSLQRYRFDAAAGCELHVGTDVYHPGDEVDLPAGQVDERLIPVGDEEPDEVVDTEAEESPTVEEPEAEEEADESEVAAEAERTVEEPTGFGNPKPRKAK